ncbi:MAG: phosphotransferase family protein [Acidimicrobiia bacterium]
MPAPTTDQVPVAILQESELRRTWVFPFDPVLSGLSEVLSVEGARRIAEPVFGRPCSVRSTIVRYRPTKRAVVRFEVRPRGRSDGPPMILYVKVLRADAADTIMQLLPVMATVGDSYVLPTYRPAPDILVYPARAGTSMRAALTGRNSAAIPHPDVVLDVLDNLGALDDPGTPGPSSPAARLDRSVDLLRAAVPHHAAVLSELADLIRGALGRDVIPPVVVHGDFYEGQLLIDQAGSVAGVLDIDDVGMGDPAMDAANYTAHLVALGESHPEVVERLDAHRRAFRTAYLERSGVEERALGAREAVAGLGLATGPFRVLSPGWPARVERRIALAARPVGVSVG